MLSDAHNKIEHGLARQNAKDTTPISASPILPAPVQTQTQENTLCHQRYSPRVRDPVVARWIAVSANEHAWRGVIPGCQHTTPLVSDWEEGR